MGKAIARPALDGGRRARPSAGEPRRWTKAKEKSFFEALAESCNVTFAAAQAGVGVSTAYRRRMVEAAFRKRWGEALATGYAQLELEMLQRALAGTDKLVRVDGESRVIKEYCDRTALALLKLHRDTVSEVDRGVDGADYDEATQRVLMRLKRLRAQLLGEVEVKTGCDRLELLRAVLRERRRRRR